MDGMDDKGFIFIPSNSKCECYKSCNTSQYLDYSDCKCKEKIIDLIVEECIEYDDDQTKIVNIIVTKTYNKTRIFNKTVTKNDTKTKLVIITVTTNDNQTKIVNILY